MSNFILDKCPKFGTTKLSLKDDKGKSTTYELNQVNNGGIIFSVIVADTIIDEIVFTPQELKAIYLLTTVKDCKK